MGTKPFGQQSTKCRTDRIFHKDRFSFPAWFSSSGKIFSQDSELVLFSCGKTFDPADKQARAIDQWLSNFLHKAPPGEKKKVLGSPNVVPNHSSVPGRMQCTLKWKNKLSEDKQMKAKALYYTESLPTTKLYSVTLEAARETKYHRIFQVAQTPFVPTNL